jgi:hypothetical protein
MSVSFLKDIKPMFREVDIDHMKVHGVHLDDYQYMSDAANRTPRIRFLLKKLTLRKS